MGRVPRELFVPVERRRYAYEDGALPIGHGQTISQPFIVATICSLLALEGRERVLDVGTGSGYQAAVLAELAAEVVTIEHVPELAERARRRWAKPATTASRCSSAMARSAFRSGLRSARSRSPRRLRPFRPRSTLSSRRAAGSSSRGALAGGRNSSSSFVPRPDPSSAPPCRVASSRSSATKDLAATDRMGGGDEPIRDYPAMTVDSSHAEIAGNLSCARVGARCVAARTGSSSSASASSVRVATP